MPIASYPSLALSQSSTFSYDQRIIESQFGDGYSQRVADGLNDKVLTVRIMHDVLTTTEYLTFLAFWNSVGKVAPFNLTDPTTGQTTKMRFIEGPAVTALSGNLYSVSISAKQTFDLVS